MLKDKTEIFINFWKPLIEKEMMLHVDSLDGVSVLKDAVSYALFSGGKRVRPLFYLAVFESIAPKNKGLKSDASAHGILSIACSFEFFHAFTLIQDDLPCMDNDVLRRGKPSLWKKFGESTALLASNVLLGMSYKSGTGNSFPFSEMLMPDSVIGGQALDLGLERGITQERINYMKTAHFFEKIARAAEFEARMIWGTDAFDENRFEHLFKFAGRFGAYFQYRDDYFDFQDNLKKNQSKIKMEAAMAVQKDLLRKMDLEDSVLGGFASWLIDKE
ncbi:hypothetical protein CL645_06100 [bacterium]|nr:hypothetical protein [bacterium]MBD62400.1 hypothetical protein [bacterium]|tara:strand:+ start:73 stop:894 length:822 start_codon:yes stop_codon:yes gene_type:complete